MLKNKLMINTEIISAFPATGKTWFFKNHPERCIDSDSSQFSWIKDENGNNTKERNPDFPHNYIQHIKESIGKVEFIFVSSHAVVREALQNERIIFTLVYPSMECKEEYIQRYIDRGSPDAFIELVRSSWEKWIKECQDQKDCVRVELNPSEYLSDIL